MKKTLLIMVMALALLLTQCRKPEVKFPTPSASEGVTVSMTVTAGPGSKTDITAAGAITWSSGDKLYVGFNGKYVGCLEIKSGQNTPTGWFSGNVTLPTGTENGEKTFHFFYLGSAERTLTVGEETVDVDFSSQNIYAEDGKLKNASKHHVGYGSAKGTVAGSEVTGINVTLVSKVALARFSFKKNSTDYTGELTLSGTNIYNDMTVNFAGTFTGKTTGNISLTGSHAERYIMLVPTGATETQTLTFTGSAEDGTGDVPGLESNKFYGKTEPIAVTLTAPTPASVFTVNKASGTKVTFAPGNLYYDGTDNKWKFEANQYDFRTYNGKGSCINGTYNSGSGTPANDWGLFGWSGSSQTHYGKITSTSNSDYSGTTLKDWGGITDLPDNAGGKTWRTLTDDEWKNLLGISGGTSHRVNAASLCAWVTLTDVSVSGLVILPDGSDATASDVTTTALVASSGAVFLPAAGYRDGTDVNDVGSGGYYWSSTPSGSSNAYFMDFMDFGSDCVYVDFNNRLTGCSVRLVRDSDIPTSSGNGSANNFTGGTW